MTTGRPARADSRSVWAWMILTTPMPTVPSPAMPSRSGAGGEVSDMACLCFRVGAVLARPRGGRQSGRVSRIGGGGGGPPGGAAAQSQRRVRAAQAAKASGSRAASHASSRRMKRRVMTAANAGTSTSAASGCQMRQSPVRMIASAR